MTKSDRPRRPGDDLQDAGERLRLDKWLWAARLYKTRGLAAEAIDNGQVRLNGARVKPAHAVRPGDAVTVRKSGVVWDVRVTGLAERRGSATDAAGLYAETPESAALRTEEALRRKVAAANEPQFSGRPTKRQRRKLEDFLNEP
ncbi:MAG: S4 domain-containing protein [Casimicrobiaceae bacterium]